MKKTAIKSVSLLLALAMLFAVVFPAGAVSFSETKANAFLKKFAAEKALSVKMADINQNPLSVSNIVLSAKLNDKDGLDIKASAKAKLSFLSADVYYDGKDLTAFLFIFKINASSLVKDISGSDILSAEQLADVAEIFKDIIKLADSPVLSAMNVDSKTDTSEKFSVSALALLTSVSGADAATVKAAMAAAGYDIEGKTDKEIKDLLVAANKAGALLPLLKAAGAKVTQKDLDLCMEYIYDSFEFTYSGNDITNIVVYDENGAETFNLSKMIPFEIKSIAAGEGSVKKAPWFGIDITGLVSGIAKSIIGTLG